MARRIDGVSTIIWACRIIVRMVDRFGTAALGAATTPELAAAVLVLIGLVKAFDALDDFPAQVDHTPGGIEDGT